MGAFFQEAKTDPAIKHDLNHPAHYGSLVESGGSTSPSATF